MVKAPAKQNMWIMAFMRIRPTLLRILVISILLVLILSESYKYQFRPYESDYNIRAWQRQTHYIASCTNVLLFGNDILVMIDDMGTYASRYSSAEQPRYFDNDDVEDIFSRFSLADVDTDSTWGGPIYWQVEGGAVAWRTENSAAPGISVGPCVYPSWKPGMRPDVYEYSTKIEDKSYIFDIDIVEGSYAVTEKSGGEGHITEEHDLRKYISGSPDEVQVSLSYNLMKGLLYITLSEYYFYNSTLQVTVIDAYQDKSASVLCDAKRIKNHIQLFVIYESDTHLHLANQYADRIFVEIDKSEMIQVVD